MRPLSQQRICLYAKIPYRHYATIEKDLDLSLIYQLKHSDLSDITARVRILQFISRKYFIKLLPG